MNGARARATQSVGDILKQWRTRRRVSQLELSIKAEVSARHLSFLETGRSHPSRAMLLRLGEHLEVPLRERNRLLLAGGYAPEFGETPLEGAGMAPVREAVRQVLAGHEPYPAVVVDRSWDLVEANAAVAAMLDGVAAHLLEPPVNVMRLSLHPEGMAPRIANLEQWRAHLLHRLHGQVEWSGDAALGELYRELAAYPCADGGAEGAAASQGPSPIAVPLRLRTGSVELSFISTVATFGTPLDVTVAELVIESFYPADRATAQALGARAQPGSA